MKTAKETNMNGHGKNFAAIVIVAFLAQACESEAKDWQSAKDARSVEALQSFVQRYNGGERTDEANALLASVLEEQLDWEAALSTATDTAFRGYLKRHPDSRFRDAAQARLETAIETLLEDLEPDFLAVVITDKHAVWRGPLAFSMNMGGNFTGGLTVVLPNPREHHIVIAVLDESGLMQEMKQGRAYLWRGENDVIDWREIPVDGDDDKVALALGFDPTNSYLHLRPSELRR